MKAFLLLVPAVLMLGSCNSTNAELEKLKNENARLKAQLKSVENAIVLTPENIREYVGAMTFSEPKGKKNETIHCSTYLQIHTFPDNVEVRWESHPEAMTLRGKGTERTAGNVYFSVGEKTLNGKYTIIFPDGTECEMPWQRTYTIE